MKYILEILTDNKLYCPNRDELNDPFEALNLEISGKGIMGGTLSIMNHKLPAAINNKLLEQRILSLTNTYESPQMWALYANDFNGVCIVFKSDKTFSNIRKVKYKENEVEDTIDISDPNFGKLFYESLFIKKKCWESENEYRIVQEKEYIDFQKEEIQCVIIGHRVNKYCSDIIYNTCKKQNIKVYQSYIDEVNKKVLFLKYPSKLTYDGRPLIFLKPI